MDIVQQMLNLLGQVGSVWRDSHVTGQIIRIMEVQCGRGLGQYTHGQRASPSRAGPGLSEGTTAERPIVFVGYCW